MGAGYRERCPRGPARQQSAPRCVPPRSGVLVSRRPLRDLSRVVCSTPREPGRRFLAWPASSQPRLRGDRPPLNTGAASITSIVVDRLLDLVVKPHARVIHS